MSDSIFGIDDYGHYMIMPITTIVMDEETEIEAKIYFDTESEPLSVDRFVTPSHGLTAHLNTLLIEDDEFSESLACSIESELALAGRDDEPPEPDISRRAENLEFGGIDTDKSY